MRRRLWLWCLVCVLGCCHFAEAETVSRVEAYSSDRLGLTAVAGEVMLPPGYWEPISATPAGALDQIYISTATEEGVEDLGLRTRVAEQDRIAKYGQSPLFSLFSLCFEYARAHSGRGPLSVTDLDSERAKNVLPLLERNPFARESPKEVKGPFFFLIPGVPIGESAILSRGAQAQPLALELHPYVDDGKHYVLLTNGRCERRPIDPDLLRLYGQTVSPVLRKAEAEAPLPSKLRRRIFSLRRGGATSAVVTIRNRGASRRLDLKWNFTDAAPGKAEVLTAWARARALRWHAMLVKSGSSILRTWTELSEKLYGEVPAADFRRFDRVPPRTTDIFSVLGGRAAIRETLQMQSLRSPREPLDEPRLQVENLKGVEVRSHPFEQLLAGRHGASLPLANFVPADKFFVYFAKPAAFFSFLDHGAEFLFRAGSLATGSSIDDNLKARYFAKLGLNEAFGREFLNSGEVLEMGLSSPDLFFVDGTDLSIIMRVAHPAVVAAKMKERGVAVVLPDAVVEARGASDRSCFWAWTGDLIMVGSSRVELEAMLALARGGAGGLGRTAEFRFMLAQLPLEKDTRAYAYFSDPFIRRMVGSRMKIGQLRRLQARADMERLLAGALLRRLDSGVPGTSQQQLAEMGYVPRQTVAGGMLAESDVVSSPVWGKLPDLKSIDAVPLGLVRQSEAEAYARYVDEYARYWRQYFDPIALRLDDGPDGTLELSTYILPLLESQLYNDLRGVLSGGSSGEPLRIPVLQPNPAFMLSMNLSEGSWVKLAGQWREMFSRYSGISPRLFDLFGPGFHFAAQDGDPIIVLGNADLMGAFGGQMLTEGVMQRAIPFLLSVLTRPCKLVIELKDENAVLDILRGASTAALGRDRSRDARGELRQLGDETSWIYSISVAETVKIRIGVRVDHGFLVLSNIPWSQPISVSGVEKSTHRGARLMLDSGGVRLGLPGLYAAEQENSQSNALGGIGHLYPLITTVSQSVEDALKWHARVFGFWPLHPSFGSWVWQDGHLASTVYGDAVQWKQPAYKSSDADFGLFEGVSKAWVNMQFEDGGMRATCRWYWH